MKTLKSIRLRVTNERVPLSSVILATIRGLHAVTEEVLIVSENTMLSSNSYYAPTFQHL